MRIRKGLEVVDDELTAAVFLTTTTGRGHAGDIGMVIATTSMLVTVIMTVMLSDGRFACVVVLVRAGIYMLRLGSAT